MTVSEKPVAIIGYSGHAYVVIDIFKQSGRPVTAYCDQEHKSNNPYQLEYLGREQDALEQLKKYDYFAAVGDNRIREKICTYLNNELLRPAVNAIHPSAIVAGTVKMGNGVMISAGAVVNPMATIGNGVVCNTGCIVEHECIIGDFVHVAPGAVLCGNVKIGQHSFVGANSVIRQGIRIGEQVIIGAGSVVIKDIPDNTTVLGNPAR
jgi:sugar O-acyltransferase (sialic acid O-acetyltransferase NeuD family)